MNEELQQAIETGTLTTELATSLAGLSPGTHCRHKSWGFGQIAEWRLSTGQILIDFEGKKGHPMQLAYAVETLTSLPASHTSVRARTEPEAVREQAKSDPVSLVRSMLEEVGGQATPSVLQSVLVPQIFDATAARKWWDSAKKKLKADGHFVLPAKKTDPVRLLDAPEASHVGLLQKFRSARYLKDQVGALDVLVKSLDDFANEVEELQTLAHQIGDVAAKGQKLQAAQALELLLARDEILARHESLQAGPDAPTIASFLRNAPNLSELFNALPAAKQRVALTSLEEAFGPEWPAKALHLMQRGSPRLASDIQKLFERKDRSGELAEALYRWINERSASSEILFWLCKERGGSYPHLFNPSLFGAVLSALELDQLAEAKKSMKLRDLVLDDGALLSDFFAKADLEVVRDAMRRLLLTTVFDDLNKRSLLGRLIKLRPELGTMVSGESQDRNESLTVSWASLERRKKEFDDLVNRQIPQNVRDIQIARSYGDLRENFEFKSAKEQQAVLARRKSELERALGNARGTNFENPDTSVVSIGTTVTLVEPDTGKTESFSILGAWDSAPERGIISYKAAIGQALLGQPVGTTITLADNRTVRITDIQAFKNLELLEQISDTPDAMASPTETPAS